MKMSGKYNAPHSFTFVIEPDVDPEIYAALTKAPNRAELIRAALRDHFKDRSGICACGRPNGKSPFAVVALCDACIICYMAGRPFGAQAEHAKGAEL